MLEHYSADILLGNFSYTPISDENAQAKVIAGFTNSQQMVLYDVIDFNRTSFKIKERTSPTAMQNAGSDRNVMSSDTTVPQKAQSVNTSISENAEIHSENGEKINRQFALPSPSDQMRENLEKYENGEITREEYLEEIDKLWGNANERYGTIPQGEKAVTPIATPKAVADDKPTRQYAKTIIETGEITGEMLEHYSADILLGNFSYTPISDENAQAKYDYLYFFTVF